VVLAKGESENEIDSRGYDYRNLQGRYESPPNLEAECVTKPDGEKCEELAVESRQPEQMRYHDARYVGFHYRYGYPDEQSFKNEKAEQTPIGLKSFASSDLAPASAKCDDKACEHGGCEKQNDCSVDANQQLKSLRKHVLHVFSLLLVLGSVCFAFGAAFDMSLMRYIAISLVCGGFGYVFGAEEADIMLRWRVSG
jgi:hypothetical protein